MAIKNPPWLIDWLWEQRHWSKWAESVCHYYAAHGFITQKQYDAAIRMKEQVEAREQGDDDATEHD